MGSERFPASCCCCVVVEADAEVTAASIEGCKGEVAEDGPLSPLAAAPADVEDLCEVEAEAAQKLEQWKSHSVEVGEPPC